MIHKIDPCLASNVNLYLISLNSNIIKLMYYLGFSFSSHALDSFTVSQQDEHLFKFITYLPIDSIVQHLMHNVQNS